MEGQIKDRGINNPLLLIWGKANENSSPPNMHPAIYHCIDTANVAGELWDTLLSSSIKDKLSEICQLPKQKLKDWFMFFSGCHDLGKFTPGFQGLIPTLTNDLHNIGLKTSSRYRIYHNTLTTHIILNHKTIGIFPSIPPKMKECVAYALGGHHGEFPSSNMLIKIDETDSGDENWQRIQEAFINKMATICKVDVTQPPKNDKDIDIFFIILSGLTSVSDWIASNSTYFPYSDETNIQKYFNLSQKRAHSAIESLHILIKSDMKDSYLFSELFPEFKASPYPMQLAAEKIISHLKGPSLLIVEAPMGEGKTETAFLLEANLSSMSGNQGCYIALPTQATANQMFNRFRGFLDTRNFGTKINLNLLHGNVVLSDEFQSLIVDGSPHVSPEKEYQVVANTWFTYRKRGLLSTFGVGTIDQSLLAVLPTRHFFVRLFGLAGKTVIFDEVHAYDTYMSTLLEELMTWLGALGSSVILLSATLPTIKSRALMCNFCNHEVDLTLADYPRITWVSTESMGSETFESAFKKANRAQSVKIRWIDRNDIKDELSSKIQSGGHIACIFNTVREAQTFYQEISDHFSYSDVEIGLLHSKYLFKTRNRKEKEYIQKYSRNNSDNRLKSRSILVSTQIIEQSLDLDFDLMITDFAPGDLILQRMGRLHRHPENQRPTTMTSPELWVIKPQLVNNKFDFGASEYIYPRYILLKSYLIMNALELISIPDDIPIIVEMIYDKEPTINNEELQCQMNEARAQFENGNINDKNQALQRAIFNPNQGDPLWTKFSEYFSDEDDNKLHTHFTAMTRLTEPSLPVVCLYRSGSKLTTEPYDGIEIDLAANPEDNVLRALLGNSVSISHPGVLRELIKHERPEAWNNNALLRNYLVLELNPSDGSCTVGKYYICIDEILGMKVKRG